MANIRQTVDLTQGTLSNLIVEDGKLKLPNVNAPTFIRSSIAYKSDGSQVAANPPRFDVIDGVLGLMVEEGTTNLVSNPSFESGMWPELWNPENGTATLVTGWNGSGNATRITITNEDGAFGIVSACNMSLSEGVKYTISFRARAIRDNFPVTYMHLVSSSVSNSVLPTIKLGTTWQRYTITYTIPAGKTASDYGLMIAIDSRHSAVYANDWIEVDDVQIEAKPYATSFIDGTRSPETLTIPTAGVLNPQEGTIECWVYVNGVVRRNIVYNWPTIVLIRKGTSVANWIWLSHTTTGAWALQIRKEDGTTTGYGSFSDSLTPDGWHYFAIRWNTQEGLAELFHNGVKRISLANVIFPAEYDRIEVGRRSGSSGDWLNSLIDDLRISSRARTDAEILSAYQSNQPLPVDAWTTLKLDFNGDLSTQSGVIP